jgi:hypothetical protein
MYYQPAGKVFELTFLAGFLDFYLTLKQGETESLREFMSRFNFNG